LHPKELAGHFGGVRFLVLLERGNEQDINAWSERLLSRVQRQVMRIRDKAVTVTCSLGMSVVPSAQVKLDAVIADAAEAAVRDAGCLEWLDNHLRSSRAEPQRLCFQVTEESATSHLPQVKALGAALRQRSFRFALEGFGSGRASSGLLEAVPLDFVKIDGTIVQGLARDEALQQRALALGARERSGDRAKRAGAAAR